MAKENDSAETVVPTTQYQAISNGHYQIGGKPPVLLVKGFYYSLTEAQFKALPKRAQDTLKPTDIVLVQKGLSENPELKHLHDTNKGR